MLTYILLKGFQRECRKCRGQRQSDEDQKVALSATLPFVERQIAKEPQNPDGKQAEGDADQCCREERPVTEGKKPVVFGVESAFEHDGPAHPDDAHRDGADEREPHPFHGALVLQGDDQFQKKIQEAECPHDQAASEKTDAANVKIYTLADDINDENNEKKKSDAAGI